MKPKLQLHREKYKAAVMYFLIHCNNSYLGSVKLNKLFYYLDFVSFRDRKKIITGDLYQKKSYGPVPMHLDGIMNEMESEHLLQIEEIERNGFIEKRSFYPRKETFNFNVFDKYEELLLKKICEIFESYSTNRIIDQTHSEAPWFYTEMKSVIDYNLSEDIDIIPSIS
jgi:uncharacterized phage-associated protein